MHGRFCISLKFEVGPFLALPVSPSLLELLIMTKVIVIVYRLTNQNGINHSNNYQPHKKKEIFETW
jgi:hypothetical protein